MSRMSHLTDHALELAEQASAGLRHASQSLRDAGVDAERWIKTGAALGAAKAGVGFARNTVRRHPVAVATAAIESSSCHKPSFYCLNRISPPTGTTSLPT